MAISTRSSITLNERTLDVMLFSPLFGSVYSTPAARDPNNLRMSSFGEEERDGAIHQTDEAISSG